ncbi:delta(8)-fatty-acid desaturase 2-like [Senna tora]|uniref:Delta(8)-fatty-acid desaturase 2-like n=1 Tax=Senna tora TaxID=362788 RepID=A0A834TU10_9FABA|nr:delta(8)-fatty-acid desaturase 2-like [Senna tora]
MDSQKKKYITSDELATHTHPHDLWISIHGAIYDVTHWAHIHPGGATPLLTFAGQDVTDVFTAFHPGETASPHLHRLLTGHHLQNPTVSAVSQDYRTLSSHFSQLGLFHSKGHVALLTLTSIALLLLAVFYGVLRCSSAWAHMGSAVLLGLLWMQSSYVGHDSGHYQVMKNRNLNQFAQILCGNCLTGISIAWWKWTHNAHHLSCNSLDHDPDLQHMPVFAVSPVFFNSITSSFYGKKLNFDPISRFLISHQHLTFYPVMCFARINLFVQTIHLLVFSNRKVQNRGMNIAGVVVFWVWFSALVRWVPNWWERVMFVMVSFGVTSIQHVQFCLNHFGGEVYVGSPRGNEWCEKQSSGSLDIECWVWMDWFFGGLQFQIEHHLFPRIPRCQLRRIAPMVKGFCEKHGLGYRRLSFWEANVWTVRTLRNAAMEARKRNLLWEALNTHG